MGCHQLFEGETGDVIAVGKTPIDGETGSGEGEALLSPGFIPQAERVKARVRPRVRKSLNCMVFELRQIILVLREKLIGHLADLGKR